jgi:hypothetical protein
VCARALDHLSRASRVRAHFRHASRVLCCIAVAEVSVAHAAEPEVSIAEPESVPAPEPRLKAPWPAIAAVFPGVLLHGAGTWLQGRTETTERLLQAEGAGLLATFAAGAVLFRTGAARNLVGPSALLAIGGVGTFGLSLLSSLYATWAPRSGWGDVNARQALLESAVGYTYVDDPQFPFHHFLTTELDARLGRAPALHLGLATAHAPDQGNQRYELESGLRLLEQPPSPERAPDGSYLEPRLGYTEHRFERSGFVTRVLEFGVEARLDSRRLLPDVRGAFFQLGAGWAEQWFVFNLPGVDALNANSLLLAHMGFGMYLQRAGELELYYDHRHEGFAGGLKALGLGSGVPGHFGLRGQYAFTPDWGLRAEAQVGSAWVLGLSALFSVGQR